MLLPYSFFIFHIQFAESFFYPHGKGATCVMPICRGKFTPQIVQPSNQTAYLYLCRLPAFTEDIHIQMWIWKKDFTNQGKHIIEDIICHHVYIKCLYSTEN